MTVKAKVQKSNEQTDQNFMNMNTSFQSTVTTN